MYLWLEYAGLSINGSEVATSGTAVAATLLGRASQGSKSDSRQEFFKRAGIAAAILAIAAAAIVHAPLASPVQDFFHEGEYLDYAGRLETGRHPFPMLIHGWLDLIPAQIAGIFCSETHLIFGTRFVNALFGGVAIGIYLVCAVLAVRPRSALSWVAILPALLFVLLFGFEGESMVLFHQAAPAIRDVVLLASLALLLWTLRNPLDEAASRTGWPLIFASGAFAGLGPFWCYDRGVIWAGIFTLTCFTLLMSRQTRPIGLFGIGGFVTAIESIWVFGPLGGIAGSLDNILYWLRYSTMWSSYPFSLQLLLQLLPVATFITVVLLLGFATLVNSWRRQDFLRTVVLIPLLLVQVGYLKIGFNRPDTVHLAWAMLPTFLLLSVCLDDPIRTLHCKSGAVGTRTAPFYPRMVLGFAVNACLSGAFCLQHYARDEKLTANWSSSLRAIASQFNDDAMIPGAVRPVIDVLRSSTASCTYVLTNEGMLYFWSRKPSCSRFAYPAYIAPAYQSEVASALAAREPDILVFDSNFWSARIDGRGLRQRTPELADWMEKRYPYAMRLDGYVLRTNKAHTGFSGP